MNTIVLMMLVLGAVDLAFGLIGILPGQVGDVSRRFATLLLLAQGLVLVLLAMRAMRSTAEAA